MFIIKQFASVITAAEFRNNKFSLCRMELVKRLPVHWYEGPQAYK